MVSLNEIRLPEYVGIVTTHYKDYIFGVEKISTCWNELITLGATEWVEVGDDERLGMFNPDWQGARRHELAGAIAVTSMRPIYAPWELHGYFVGVVGRPLKTAGQRTLNEVGVYIQPEARKGWYFKKLLEKVEEMAKLMQCNALIVSHRPEHDYIGKMYRRYGYTPLSVDYIKSIS